MIDLLMAVAISVAIPVALAVITPLYIVPLLDKHKRIANMLWGGVFSVCLFPPLIYKGFKVKGLSVEMLILVLISGVLGAIYGYTT